MRTLVIWGAGRIGRGFVADLFQESDWRVVFVDIDNALVESLNTKKKYTIFNASTNGITQKQIDSNFTAFHTSQTNELERIFLEDDLLVDIAVHEPKLQEVAHMVAPLIKKRSLNHPAPIDIMMNVNMQRPDLAFRQLLEKEIGDSCQQYLDEFVGITGIAAICISPFPTDQMKQADPLAVLNNGYPEQAIGVNELRGPLPHLKRIRLADDIPAEETRKLFTMNMAHALLCYLGIRKGYEYVVQAMNDPELRKCVSNALSEAVGGLWKHYSFSSESQETWVNKILGLLDNPYINDSLRRLGADTRRKLSHSDRLCGPALLCLDSDIVPCNIAKAIRAGFDFENDDIGTKSVQTLVREQGLDEAIHRICGLTSDNPLFQLIKASEI